jgi:hypothetical protein
VTDFGVQVPEPTPEQLRLLHAIATEARVLEVADSVPELSCAGSRRVTLRSPAAQLGPTRCAG